MHTTKHGAPIISHTERKPTTTNNGAVDSDSSNGAPFIKQPYSIMDTNPRISQIKGSTAAIDVTLGWFNHSQTQIEWHVENVLQISDHFPITINVHTPPRCATPTIHPHTSAPHTTFPHPPRIIRQSSLSEDAWRQRTAQLQLQLDTLPDPSLHLDDALHQFTTTLQKIWKPTSPLLRAGQPPWWTPTLQKARRSYWTKTKQLQRQLSRCPPDNAPQRQEILTLRRKARNEYQMAISSAKRISWNLFVAHMDNPWPAFHKYLKGRKQRKTPQYRTANNPPQFLTPEQFLTQFAIPLESNTPDPSKDPPPWTHRWHTQAQRKALTNWTTPITNSETYQAIQETPPNKAPGPDGLSPNIYRRTGNITTPWLTKLFNKLKNQQEFPSLWKAGEGILLPKAGREHQTVFTPKDYRLIVLYPILGKIYERVILNRLQRYRDWSCSTATTQHGFTHTKSCYTALLRFVDEIQQGLGARRHAAAIFLDVAGAFDNVPHPQLVNALQLMGLPPTLISLLQSYLTQRCTRLTLADHTKIVHHNKGTPQGGVLSPILWNCYLDTLLHQLATLPNISAQAYADDLAIWATDRHLNKLQHKLQHALTHVHNWSTHLQLQFQPLKTTFMTFRYRGTPPTLQLYLQNEALRQVSQMRYLGVHIDSHFTWLPHIHIQVPRIVSYASKLLPALRQNRPLPKSIVSSAVHISCIPCGMLRTHHLGSRGQPTQNSPNPQPRYSHPPPHNSTLPSLHCQHPSTQTHATPIPSKHN